MSVDPDAPRGHQRVASATALAVDDLLPSAVPTLKVMRLQAPQLGVPASGGAPAPCPSHLLSSTLLLPDSFGVIHVGETFSAYLGVLNPSKDMAVRGLTVSAQLQTPSRRIALPSRLDDTPRDIEPGGGSGVDAIVSRRLEEPGPHILRVEVGYVSNGSKSLRKFYRFNVTVPLKITESVTRSGDASCVVSVTVENVAEGGQGAAVTIHRAGFEPTAGLVAERIEMPGDVTKGSGRRSALDLYDSCGRLGPGETVRYLFSVHAESEAATLRGVACGDDLGRAVLRYHKAMGEPGKILSNVVVCPPTSYSTKTSGPIDTDAETGFVVHRSGLAVDVSAASAQRSMAGRGGGGEGGLDDALPVTVEPIEPPSEMDLSVPRKVSLLVVNHSSRPMTLQVQMRLSEMEGVVVCGPSFVSLGGVPPSGGSCTVDVRLVALVAGLFSVRGCYVVDLSSGMELCQPALFDVFVKQPDDAEEKKSADMVDF